MTEKSSFSDYVSPERSSVWLGPDGDSVRVIGHAVAADVRELVLTMPTHERASERPRAHTEEEWTLGGWRRLRDGR